MTLLVCVVAALSRSPVGRLVLVLKEAVDVAGVKPTTGILTTILTSSYLLYISILHSV